MTLRRTTKKYWSCPKCGTRNERIKQKCAGENCTRSRPKPRVAPHAKTLRDDDYQAYLQVNREAHGVDEECAICGRERDQDRRLDRDHEHASASPIHGKPRGLLCVACNKRLEPRHTEEFLFAAAEYFRRAREYHERLRDAA